MKAGHSAQQPGLCYFYVQLWYKVFLCQRGQAQSQVRALCGGTDRVEGGVSADCSHKWMSAGVVRCCGEEEPCASCQQDAAEFDSELWATQKPLGECV